MSKEQKTVPQTKEDDEKMLEASFRGSTRLFTKKRKTWEGRKRPTPEGHDEAEEMIKEAREQFTSKQWLKITGKTREEQEEDDEYDKVWGR